VIPEERQLPSRVIRLILQAPDRRTSYVFSFVILRALRGKGFSSRPHDPVTFLAFDHPI